MAETQAEFVIKIIQMIIISSILILLIIRRKREKIKALNWFILVFIFATLHGITELVIYYIKIYVLHLENPSYFRFNEFHSIPYSIAIMILYIMAESIIDDNINPIRMFLSTSLWTSYITLLFYETFNNFSIVFDSPATSQISNTIFDVFQIYTMSILTWVFYRARLKSKNIHHRKATFAMFLASLFYVISIAYELGEDLLNFPNVYGAITLGISFLVLAYIFVKYPYYVFSVPTTVYRIILTSNFHQSLVYNTDILNLDDDNNPNKYNTVLLASGIASIAAFMKDTTGSNKSLQYAYLGDRAMLLHKGALVTGIIIAEKSTFILKSALKQLVKEFEDKYQNEIKLFNANISQFFDSKFIIARTFPFIESEEIIDLKIQQGSI